jgi:uncharacterized protein YecT (DUF1311 family)
MNINKYRICWTGLVILPWLGLLVGLPLSSEATAHCQSLASDLEYKQCARNAYVASDKKINRLYKSLLSKLTGTEQQELIEAQTAWIESRNVDCNFEVYRHQGVPKYGGFPNNCLERMTKERIEELQDWDS